jgi:hypothetical protein
MIQSSKVSQDNANTQWAQNGPYPGQICHYHVPDHSWKKHSWFRAAPYYFSSKQGVVTYSKKKKNEISAEVSDN